MKLLQLRTNLYYQVEENVPFSVYTVGTEDQKTMIRLKGFSAKQLFLTFSGTGVFRSLDQDKWDIVPPNTFLYIPAEIPHEYLPQGQDPWYVGYVSFVEKNDTFLESWGFGQTPIQFSLQDMPKLFGLLDAIWHNSGSEYDVWQSTACFFSFYLELKKQTSINNIKNQMTPESQKQMRYRDSVVDSAIRFLHDHLQRDLTMAELSVRVGYSSKQLNRLFQQSLGLTPLQYLQKIRLQSAALLLVGQPKMTVRQIASYIGMDPVYFTRLFKRQYGLVPSSYGKGGISTDILH